MAERVSEEASRKSSERVDKPHEVVIIGGGFGGLLFGLVHWAVVGMALGMMPLMHPRICYGGAKVGSAG